MAALNYNNTAGSVSNPRILVVTPEITYLPEGMGNMSNYMKAKAGGLADVSASLISALFELGADVHVALPHYRRIFHIEVTKLIDDELRIYKKILPESRIHLAQDRVFYYRDQVYSGYYADSQKIALAFQREVINNIVPKVAPDLVHCNDWMTGLVPAAARRMGIPSLLTIHNIHTQEISLAQIEDRGIDAAEFWNYLYYTQIPFNYEETRDRNKVDCLASGIFAAHFVNTVSSTFLEEICRGYHNFIPGHIRHELIQKKNSGCAFGILNAPDPSFNPQTDGLIKHRYSAKDHRRGKLANKRELQQRLGLIRDDKAPLFFWPSRLDPLQKGPQLLAEIMYQVISAYWKKNLQIVMVANGPFQQHFHDIVGRHDFYKRAAVCDFDEELSHLAYAASDFIFIPSQFEQSGLTQMISAIYGSLPVAHNTGGLHDTVSHLDLIKNKGNGFVFNTYDSNGLRWAVNQAMKFYSLPQDIKDRQISRIMTESAREFTHSATAKKYISLYETMLKRPLVLS